MRGCVWCTGRPRCCPVWGCFAKLCSPAISSSVPFPCCCRASTTTIANGMHGARPPGASAPPHGQPACEVAGRGVEHHAAVSAQAGRDKHQGKGRFKGLLNHWLSGYQQM